MNGESVAPARPGEIEVRGSNVFAGILGQAGSHPRGLPRGLVPHWRYCGDRDGVYRILGRTNIDILKTGGNKVSALEIEETCASIRRLRSVPWSASPIRSGENASRRRSS